MLLESKADPNVQNQVQEQFMKFLINKDGATSLHIACMRSHVEIAQMLMKAGADASISDKVLKIILP